MYLFDNVMIKIGSKVKFVYSFGDYEADVTGEVISVKDDILTVKFEMWGPYDDDPREYVTSLPVDKVISND